MKNRGRKTRKIQHHHFLLRMETRHCPEDTDKEKAKELLERIVRDLHMKLLGEPRVYYVKYPRYNEGLTALAPIQTSHIAFHFWKNPDRRILHSTDSHCLLQLDVYTCGRLELKHIEALLHHLTHFGPTHVNATLLNRNYSLTLERQMLWDAGDGKKWVDWVRGIPEM